MISGFRAKLSGGIRVRGRNAGGGLEYQIAATLNDGAEARP